MSFLIASISFGMVLPPCLNIVQHYPQKFNL
jgi:hypothetical protein